VSPGDAGSPGCLHLQWGAAVGMARSMWEQPNAGVYGVASRGAYGALQLYQL